MDYFFFSKKGEIIEQISEIHRVRTDEHGVNMDGPWWTPVFIPI